LKVPKEIRTYCPKCNKHTLHTVALYKKGKERTGSLGARRHAEDKKGYGGQKFPEQSKTVKTTKKQTLRLACRNCGYKLMKFGIRLKKIEIEA